MLTIPEAVARLQAMHTNEDTLRRKPKPYLSGQLQTRADQAHLDNMEALKMAVQALQHQDLILVNDDDPGCSIRQESDEYFCIQCRMRWDVREDQPPCPLK